MNSNALPSHWPEAARLALLELTATVPDGCGSCVHAGWGALPPYGIDSSASCASDDFQLVVCAKGAAIRAKDGRLEVLRYCTRWNGDSVAGEPPPLPDSSLSGAARFSPARPGLIPSTRLK